MSRRRRTTPRQRRGPGSVVLGAVSVLVSALAIVVGGAIVAADPVDRAETPLTPRPPDAIATPLADYDRNDILLERAPFCGRITDEAAALALGVEATGAPVAWRPGTRVPGTESIANEWGCSVTAGDVTASAWVFGMPVSDTRAREWAREARRGDCKPKDVPDIGSPAVVVTCSSGRDKHTTYQGLVVDTWLVCRMTGTGDAERVGRWCGVVLDAVRAP